MGVRQDFARVPLVKPGWQKNGGQKKGVSEKLPFFCPHFSASLPR
jgi:hypothetical protein